VFHLHVHVIGGRPLSWAAPLESCARRWLAAATWRQTDRFMGVLRGLRDPARQAQRLAQAYFLPWRRAVRGSFLLAWCLALLTRCGGASPCLLLTGGGGGQR